MWKGNIKISPRIGGRNFGQSNVIENDEVGIVREWRLLRIGIVLEAVQDIMLSY